VAAQDLVDLALQALGRPRPPADLRQGDRRRSKPSSVLPHIARHIMDVFAIQPPVSQYDMAYLTRRSAHQLHLERVARHVVSNIAQIFERLLGSALERQGAR